MFKVVQHMCEGDIFLILLMQPLRVWCERHPTYEDAVLRWGAIQKGHCVPWSTESEFEVEINRRVGGLIKGASLLKIMFCPR